MAPGPRARPSSFNVHERTSSGLPLGGYFPLSPGPVLPPRLPADLNHEIARHERRGGGCRQRRAGPLSFLRHLTHPQIG
jgi:hypothetical protein